MFKASVIFFLYLNHVSPLEFSVWGPGISPETIILPARYFFINISTHDESLGEIDHTKLAISINGKSESGSCRLWQQVLNRKDNSFIVRYRLYEECNHLKIELKYGGNHIGESPYLYKGPIYNEDCFCPVDDFEEWMNHYGCSKQIDQIDNDMKQFQNVNITKVLKYTIKQFNNPGSMSYCHYNIMKNKLYRKCYGKHVGFHIFSDAILQSVLRKVKIPDQSFFLNLGDWPLVKKNSKIIPMFSWCGSVNTWDIVLPSYDLTESTLENMGRVMLDMLSVQGNIERKWDEKIPLGFWRGRDSSRERLKLVDISRQYPHLYNVSLTNFFFFRDEEEKYGPKVPHISFFKFFDYKYQITIDGSVASYRMPYLLVGDSVVLKQQSQYYEHFYKHLKAGEHYISVKSDLSDLTEQLKWAMENDDKAQTIARNGRKFAQENLMPKDVICYYALALKEWSKRVLTPVEIFKGMEEVGEKDIDEQKCKCSHLKKRLQDEL